MATAAALASGALVASTTTGAGADIVNRQLSASCALGGLSTTVTLPFSSSDAPDPATAGGAVALAVTPSTPTFTGYTATVTSVELAIPVPPQVTVGSVTFSGGNLAGSASITPNEVTITYTGSVAQEAVSLGTFTLNAAVKANTGGQTISWAVPSSVVVALQSQGTGLVAGCVPDATTPLNTTPIGFAPTSTTSTTSTTAPTTTTSTTAPTTTTSTTSTTNPTTTTSTTTSTTSTTKPTTTTTTTTSTTTTTKPTTTTTTTSTTTTTKPTTTTSTTTTTRPTTTTSTTTTSTTTTSTTTTTRPTTTTTRPTTTTTRPTTTTTKSFVEVIFCLWFRLFC